MPKYKVVTTQTTRRVYEFERPTPPKNESDLPTQFKAISTYHEDEQLIEIKEL